MALWREIAALEALKILISSELFHSKVSSAGGVVFFKQISEILEDSEVRVIFYIRRQSQWPQSAYQQWIKVSNLAQNIEQFTNKYKNNLADQVFLCADIFGKENVSVRPYERTQLHNEDIFSDFFRLLGLRIDGTYDLPANNSNPY